MTVENNFGMTQIVSDLPTQKNYSLDTKNPEDAHINNLREQIEATVQVLEKQLEEDVASKKFEKAYLKSFTNRKSELMVMKMDRLPLTSK